MMNSNEITQTNIVMKIIENFNIGLYLEAVLYGIVSVGYSIIMIFTFYKFIVKYYKENKDVIKKEIC